VWFVAVDNDDLNGELDEVSHQAKNGMISSDFRQALSSHFDSVSHRDNNKDIGTSHIPVVFMFVQAVKHEELCACNSGCVIVTLLSSFFLPAYGSVAK